MSHKKNKPVSRLVESCLRCKNSSNQDGLISQAGPRVACIWVHHLSWALTARVSLTSRDPHCVTFSKHSAMCLMWASSWLPSLIRARFIHLKQVSRSSGGSLKESSAEKMLLSTSLNLWVSDQISRNNGKSGSSYNLASSHKLHIGFHYTWHIWGEKKNIVQMRQVHTKSIIQ